MTAANSISTQFVAATPQLPVVSDHRRQLLALHLAISSQAFTALKQAFGF